MIYYSTFLCESKDEYSIMFSMEFSVIFTILCFFQNIFRFIIDKMEIIIYNIYVKEYLLTFRRGGI